MLPRCTPCVRTPSPSSVGSGTSKNDGPYMVRVQQATAGVLHDHLALFKARGGSGAAAGHVGSRHVTSHLAAHPACARRPLGAGGSQRLPVRSSNSPGFALPSCPPCPPCPQIDLDVLGTANKVVQKQIKVGGW